MTMLSQQLKKLIAQRMNRFLGYDPMELVGEITIFQSENGIEVPGTRKKFFNTIQDDLYAEMFQEMSGGNGDLYFDNFCVAGTGVTDGIVLGYASGGSGAIDAYAQLNTVKNAGGDGTLTYIEFYGVSNAALGAAVTYMDISLVMSFATSPSASGQYFANKSISYTVQSGRRAHVYYKISKPTGVLPD